MCHKTAENDDNFLPDDDQHEWELGDWEGGDLAPLGDELLAGFLPDDDGEPLPERGDFWVDDSLDD